MPGEQSPGAVQYPGGGGAAGSTPPPFGSRARGNHAPFSGLQLVLPACPIGTTMLNYMH